MPKHIVVIGAGPSGIDAALTASRFASVTLVSDGPPGDWGVMLPSRVWLAAKEQILSAHRPPAADGEDIDSRTFSLEVVRANTGHATTGLHRSVSTALETANVSLVTGRARFTSESDLVVSNAGVTESLTGDSFILATGSAGIFPPGLEPDGQRVFCSRTINQISEWPSSILVIGDGPVGFEYVDLFSFLGIDVTWLVLDGGPASTWDSEADDILIRTFVERGVDIQPGPLVQALDRSESGVQARFQSKNQVGAEAAFITIGRRPVTENLGLEEAGIQLNERGMIEVDDYARTNVSHIYAVGDVVRTAAAGSGMAQGRIAALHASGQPTAPFTYRVIPYGFGHNPAVSRVGVLESPDTTIHKEPYGSCLSAHVNFVEAGFVKLAWDKRGVVVGGLAVGLQAADVITPIAMAVRLELTLETFAEMSASNPTISELAFIAARNALRQHNS